MLGISAPGLTCCGSRTQARRFSRVLVVTPAPSVCRRMGNYAQQHARVLQATIFGAVAHVGARLNRLDPHSILAIGNQIGFAGELRHPETVRHIRRLEPEESRPSLA